MKKRRKEVLAALEDDETYLTVGMFPRLGVPAFTEPVYKPTPESGITMSLFVPDELICQNNPIYKATFISLEKRRGKRANVNIPIFKDRNTPDPFTENLEALGGDVQFGVEAKPNHVYEDCSVIGQASCTLQTTIQASCLEDSKFVHDQLCVLAPIMMALSASSPVRRGYLTDHDCRWQAMAESFDDRTRREINHPETLDYKIPNHSRWESNFLYFSSGNSMKNFPGDKTFTDINFI
ncbi:glutamate--cysteine ligase catalytic subunit-like [Tachypleus tridentatus]|uniref:glutamate--cysteine ligase catalytic subunit-like n=1 Tax=Tachypleus tridentatus TaxID=6853 RepID=UPI003FD0F189